MGRGYTLKMGIDFYLDYADIKIVTEFICLNLEHA